LAAPLRKYAIGDRVELSPGRLDGNIPRGVYTVARLMPHEGGEYQYRLKHSRDLHERVAPESQLRRG
jgi:hypothetical protein